MGQASPVCMDYPVVLDDDREIDFLENPKKCDCEF
jgi:hypothetical protein